MGNRLIDIEIIISKFLLDILYIPPYNMTCVYKGC